MRWNKQDKKKKLKEAQSIQKNKVKSKKKVIKKKVNNKKDNHKKKIKSKNNKHDDDAIGVPNLKLHKCKACKKYFKNVAALKSHVKACKVKHKKHWFAARMITSTTHSHYDYVKWYAINF